MSEDIFNRENESFPQGERLLTNEFSANLPTQYRHFHGIVFLSIIAEYDLNHSICELGDSAIVFSTKVGKADLIEKMDSDDVQQTISIEDNAGFCQIAI